MLKTLILASLVFTTVASAKDITYVGQGRSVCAGSDCKQFDADQRSKNYFQERIDAEKRDYSDNVKDRQLQERLQAIERKYKNQE